MAHHLNGPKLTSKCIRWQKLQSNVSLLTISHGLLQQEVKKSRKRNGCKKRDGIQTLPHSTTRFCRLQGTGCTLGLHLVIKFLITSSHENLDSLVKWHFVSYKKAPSLVIFVPSAIQAPQPKQDSFFVVVWGSTPSSSSSSSSFSLICWLWRAPGYSTRTDHILHHLKASCIQLTPVLATGVATDHHLHSGMWRISGRTL